MRKDRDMDGNKERGVGEVREGEEKRKGERSDGEKESLKEREKGVGVKRGGRGREMKKEEER